MKRLPLLFASAVSLLPALAHLDWAVAAPHGAHIRGSEAGRKRPFRRVYDPKNTKQLPASWTIAGQPYLAPNEYADLKGGTVELLKRYPPDKYYFVAMGRDAAPVVAFLQNLGEDDLAVHLTGTSNIDWTGNGFTPADVALHIEAAIPKHILQGDRELVLIDVTSSGKTPAVVGPLVDAYLASIGRKKATSIKLAISWKNVMAGGYGNRLTDWLDVSKWPDFQRYFSGKYEGAWHPSTPNQYGIGEWQRHQWGPGVQPPTVRNPNYIAFRQALLERMSQDPELDGFLTSLGADDDGSPAAPTAGDATGSVFKRPTSSDATAASQPTLRPPGSTWKSNFHAWRGNGPAQAFQPLLHLNDLPEPDAAPGTQPKQFSYLDGNEYATIRDMGGWLLKTHMPRQAFLVGVGRSAGPVHAFLATLGDNVSAYLPMDGLGKLAEKGQVGADRLAQFHATLDAFIPTQALTSGRDLVLYQKLDSGDSLRFLQPIVQRWVASKGSSARVLISGFGEQGAANTSGYATSMTFPLGAPVVTELGTRKFNLVAPYDHHRPSAGNTAEELPFNPSTKKPNPVRREYLQFAAALQVRMAADSNLSQLISVLAQ